MGNQKKYHYPQKLLYFKYSLISIPLSFVGLPLYIHVPKFYYNTYQVELQSLGLILLLLRLSDAFVDPIIGYLSDKNQGHMKQIMAIGCALLILGFNGLFWAPKTFQTQELLIWFSFCTAITYLGYSILAINFYGAGISLAQNYEGRTTLSSWREGLGLFGILLASSIPSFLEHFYSKQIAFQLYGGILTLFVVLALFIFPSPKTSQKPLSITIWKDFKSFILRQHNFRWLIILFFVNALPVAITSTLFLFYLESVLKASELAGLFLTTYFLSAAFSTVFWNEYSKKCGKRISLYSSMSLALVSCLGSYFLNPDSAHWFYLVCFLSGFALGGDLVILPSLLADVVGTRVELRNMNFSLWQFINKIALGFSAGLLFLFLPYVSSGQDFAHSPTLLLWSYALFPCLIKALAMILLKLSPIDKQKKMR